jgi:hypothetical protein
MTSKVALSPTGEDGESDIEHVPNQKSR